MTETDAITREADQATLAAALLNPVVYGLPIGERIERIETHISYVFLAGPHAYKIKKAVDLGFLNFRTLSARRFYCEEELRLNRRLAPALYLDVIAITGAPARPVLAGDGPAIEWVVKMRRFAPEDALDQLLDRAALMPDHIDRLAATIAAFHDRAARASAADTFGTPEAIRRPAMDNFAALRASGAAADDIAELERWTARRCEQLEPTFHARRHDGFVRECHGDLHLRNVAVIDGVITPFDCIEFDPSLRWIDVVSEVAFLIMDLYDHDRPALARRFLNRYLESTGDYAGLNLMHFYIAYRALVRAKIHRLRAGQPSAGADDRARLLEQYRGYIALAETQRQTSTPALVITHGVSGSGKTTGTQSLVESTDAVRVRSDVERKRLQSLVPLARTASGIEAGTYSAAATARTYERLLDLAKQIIDAGYTAIVDATFLKRAQRDLFRRWARERAVPFVILDFTADIVTLKTRLQARHEANRDASEANIEVLQHQLATQEPLQPDELPFVARDTGRMPFVGHSQHGKKSDITGRQAPRSEI